MKYRRLALVIFIVLIVWWVYINDMLIAQTSDHVYYKIADLQTGQTVMILWASVYSDGRLSRIAKDRADKAIEVRKSGKAATILISADNSKKNYDETRTIRNYLVQQWIPHSIIFQDFAWFDTYDSMYRARDIFGVQHIIISTQLFHQPRSIWIAQKLGMTAQWIVADSYVPRDQLRNNARESLAKIKARINVSIDSKPYFLGSGISITWESNGRD